MNQKRLSVIRNSGFSYENWLTQRAQKPKHLFKLNKILINGSFPADIKTFGFEHIGEKRTPMRNIAYALLFFSGADTGLDYAVVR